jgi:hypothetical protein
MLVLVLLRFGTRSLSWSLIYISIMACPIDVDTTIGRHALKSRVIREEYNTRYFGYLLVV